MVVFDCVCGYRFIVGRKRVYGPIYAIGLPGHFTGQHGCHSQGRMMGREEFEDDYSDCSAQLWREADPEDRTVTEKELDNAVAKLAKLLGIWAYHTRISVGSQRGMPDWLLIGTRGLMFREDKTETGKLTPEQADVGAKLQALGYDFATWRPRDLRSGRIAAELEAIR